MHLWYGHPGTHVLLVDTDLPAGAHTNMQPYAGRGWCVMESKASGLVKLLTHSCTHGFVGKDLPLLISLKGLTGKEKKLDWAFINNGNVAREPPTAPLAFASTLEAGVATGAITFAYSGDVGPVADLYGKAFAAEMAAVVTLSYYDTSWGDAQMLRVCEALRAAHAGGGLRKLELLNLGWTRMGDGAAAALAALIEDGAMPNLEWLHLGNNVISNTGVAALASALRGGALPSCTEIRLSDNPGNHAPVKEALGSPERAAAVTQNASYMAAVVKLHFCKGSFWCGQGGWDDAQMLTLCEALRAAHAGGGLRKLESLSLSGNRMGDGAAAALAALLEEEGAMPNLERLWLSNNQISDAGVTALASALQGGALPSCTFFDLANNQISDRGVIAFASALREGALPSCTKTGWGGIMLEHNMNPGSDAPVEEALASAERAAALARRQDELRSQRRQGRI